jgi:hypothetical protein
MTKGDFADMCAGKFPLVLMGGTSGHVKLAQAGSEDPPSARSEILTNFVEILYKE